MKASALGALLIGGTSTAMLPLRKFKSDTSLEDFFQQHYDLLTPERMERILTRIEKEVKERYGVDADVQDPKPIPRRAVRVSVEHQPLRRLQALRTRLC